MADGLVAGQAQLAAQPRGRPDVGDVGPAVEASRATQCFGPASPPAPSRRADPHAVRRAGRGRAHGPGRCAAMRSSERRRGSSCCSASESASSGFGWTSTMTPSAPTATPPIASGFTSQRLPVACYGSTMTGRWVRWWSERHRGQVHRVARVRLERADAALAQDDVGVARADDVLGGHQPLLDRRAVAALEHDRAGDPPDVAQQRVVLHVPGADLEDVRVLGHDVDLVRLHHLGDDRQPGPLARLGEVAERLDAQALEGVRAGPRLERAAAQDRGAGRLRRRRRSRTAGRGSPPSTARPSRSASRRRSTASRTRMTVSSGWNSREVSLNGRLIGVTVSTPGSAANRSRSTGRRAADLADDRDDDVLAPGMVEGVRPSARIRLLTPRISASLAPVAITTNIASGISSSVGRAKQKSRGLASASFARHDPCPRS